MDRFLRALVAELCRPGAVLVLVGGVMLVVAQGALMGVDEAIWNHMGRTWVHGQAPYRDVIDNKPPGIYMIYAAAYALAGTGCWLPRLLGVLASTAAAGGAYLLGKRLMGNLAGAMAALMMGLSMAWETLDGANAAQTEPFMILPAIFAFVVLLKTTSVNQPQGARDYSLSDGSLPVSSPLDLRPSPFALRPSPGWIALAGVLIGVAISFKQTALFSALAWVIAYALLARRPSPISDSQSSNPDSPMPDPRIPIPAVLGDLCVFSLACLATMSAFVLPVLMSGASLGDYWFGTWVLPLLPGTGNNSLASRREKFLHVWTQAPMVLFYLPLALAVWRRKALAAAGVPLAALTVWAVLEFIAAGSSGFFYGHQIKQAVPPLALLGALGLVAAIRWKGGAVVLQGLQGHASEDGSMAPGEPRPEGSGPVALRATALVLVVVLAAVLPYGTIYQALCGSGPDPDRAMGQYIRDHSAPDEGVLALDWHGFQIHAWSDRPSPSRWFNKFFLELPQARKELARDLARRPPKFVALPAWFGDDPWPNYMLAIQPRYKLVYTDRRKNPVEQYELFELQPAGGRPG